MDDLEILGITKKIAEKFDNAKTEAREDYKLLQMIRFIQSKQFDSIVHQCDTCKQETKKRVLEVASERGFNLDNSEPKNHTIELNESLDVKAK